MYLDSVLHTWFSSRVDDSILFLSVSTSFSSFIIKLFCFSLSILGWIFLFHKSRESLNFSFLLILSSSRCGGGL